MTFPIPRSLRLSLSLGASFDISLQNVGLWPINFSLGCFFNAFSRIGNFGSSTIPYPYPISGLIWNNIGSSNCSAATKIACIIGLSIFSFMKSSPTPTAPNFLQASIRLKIFLGSFASKLQFQCKFFSSWQISAHSALLGNSVSPILMIIPCTICCLFK